MASDDFDDIAEAITPKTLGACSTNALLKAFEVSLKTFKLNLPMTNSWTAISFNQKYKSTPTLGFGGGLSQVGYF